MSKNFIRVLNRKFDGSPSGGSRGRTHDEQSISQLASVGAKFVVLVVTEAAAAVVVVVVVVVVIVLWPLSPPTPTPVQIKMI